MVKNSIPPPPTGDTVTSSAAKHDEPGLGNAVSSSADNESRVEKVPDCDPSAAENMADLDNRKHTSPLIENVSEADRNSQTDLVRQVEIALEKQAFSTEQNVVDGLELLAQLLERENCELKLAASVGQYRTSRTGYMDRLSELVDDVCVKYTEQTEGWVKRIGKLRQLLGDICDTVEDKLTQEMITQRPSKKQNSQETEQEAVAAAKVAEARLAVSRASARLARNEEQAAMLEKTAAECAHRAAEIAAQARLAERQLEEAALAEEQKLKEELEKAKREELERKAAEAAAERKRIEEERKRKAELAKKKLSDGGSHRTDCDPSKWPTLVYSADPGETGIAVGCVIRLRPDGLLRRDDVHVQSVDQLHCGLTLGPSEELISNIIRLQEPRTDQHETDDDQEALDSPVFIAVPYINARPIPSREPVVMARIAVHGAGCPARWSELTTREVTFDDIREYKFVEVRLNCLQLVQSSVHLAVVSRLKRDVMSVSRRALRVCSSVDQRISFSFNSEKLNSKKPVNFVVEVQPVDLLTIQDVKHRCPEICERLLAASPIVRLTSTAAVAPVDPTNPALSDLATDVQNDTSTPEMTADRGPTEESRPTSAGVSATAIASAVTSAAMPRGQGSAPVAAAFPLPPALLRQPVVVSLPVPPNPAKQRRPATSVSEGRSGDGSGRGPNSGTSTAAGSGRGAAGSGDASGKGRPKTAASLYKAAANDDGMADDVVCLLTKDEDDTAADRWMMLTSAKPIVQKNSDVVSFELPKIIKGRMIAVRKLVGGASSEMEMAVRQLELGLQHTAINALLRHRNGDPVTMTTDVTVQFLTPGKLDRTIKKLADDGFPGGPPVGTEMLLKEGQQLILRFRGNICSADGRTEIRTVYNSNIRTKIDFQAAVLDKFAQKSIEVYRGFVQVYTTGVNRSTMPSAQRSAGFGTSLNPGHPADDVKARPVGTGQQSQQKSYLKGNDDLSETLLCELLVSIPKPEPEAVKVVVARAPVVLHTDGVVDADMLRHLSAEIGNEWRHLAQSLGIRRVRLQAILSSNVTSDTQQTVYEMLTSWLKKLPRSINKAGLLRTALQSCGRNDLAEYVAVRQEESVQRMALLSARGSTLRRAMVTVARHVDMFPEWTALGRLLGLDQRDLDAVTYRSQGQRERCFDALVVWSQQPADVTIADGTERSVHGLIKLLKKGRYHQLADIVQTEFHGRG